MIRALLPSLLVFLLAADELDQLFAQIQRSDQQPLIFVCLLRIAGQEIEKARRVRADLFVCGQQADDPCICAPSPRCSCPVARWT